MSTLKQIGILLAIFGLVVLGSKPHPVIEFVEESTDCFYNDCHFVWQQNWCDPGYHVVDWSYCIPMAMLKMEKCCKDVEPDK